jgi:hypothetical protein
LSVWSQFVLNAEGVGRPDAKEVKSIVSMIVKLTILFKIRFLFILFSSLKFVCSRMANMAEIKPGLLRFRFLLKGIL